MVPMSSQGGFGSKNNDVDKTTQKLIWLAGFAESPAAREKSFEILRLARVPIPEYARDPLLKSVLPKVPLQLRDAAWAYLVDVATTEDVRVLRESAHGTWLESRLDWLEAWLGTGRSLGKFLQKVPDPQLIPEPMRRSIIAGIDQLPAVSLDALWSMPVPALQDAAAKELRSRGLPVGEVRRVTPGPMRVAPPSASLGLGQFTQLPGPAPSVSAGGSTGTDEARYERLGQTGNADLTGSLNWYNLDGPPSYRLLVERGHIPREVVHRDLSEQFKRIHEESDEQLRRVSGETIVAKIREDWAELGEFIAGLYTTAALAALVKVATPDDVPIARGFLNESAFRKDVLPIIAALGAEEDVPGLIEIARSSFGEERKMVLDAVESLTRDKLRTARVLISSEGREMRGKGLSLVASLSDPDAIPLLIELLAHQNEGVRVTAVAQLYKRVPRDRMVQLLCNYIVGGWYFYNVVVWMDRLIYAPALVSAYYEKELREALDTIIS